ncbi:TniQ family protein [Undibacterium sp. Ji42W]|uniref:TniQ family protein n=1 Tax=Undibacterium sp. Ji42W TaxID=3413039 RepID=UPI003BF45B54
MKNQQIRKLRVWPIHPMPLEDELISSWMIRIAQANRSKIHTFYASQFGRHREIWTRDIDHLAPIWLIDELSEHTGCSREIIRGMTLRSLESKAFQNFNESGETNFILPLSIFHRTRRGYGQQFCPLCLSTDPVSYLRRSWRLAFNTICSKHKILLRDRCDSCLQPLVPHRADMHHRSSYPEKDSMRRCAFCHKKFGEFSRLAEADELRMQQKFDLVCSSGYSQIDCDTTVYSHLYFEGIRVLMLGESKLSKSIITKMKIEHASVEERLTRLSKVFKLLDDWPENFLKFCCDKKAPYSAFCQNSHEIPYWLNSVLRRNVFQGYAPVSDSELIAIADVVDRSGCKSPLAEARRISGRDTSKFFRVVRVDDDTADILLASIDHSISTASKNSRLILLRDKVMFISARCLNLSVTELLEYNVPDSLEMAAITFSFWDRVETKSQVEAMLCWYCNHVRVKAANKESRSLFLTNNGKKLHKSSVGQRFQNAVRFAGLERAISGWKSWVQTR